MCLWAFYAGHGVMQDQSFICLNVYLNRFHKHEFNLDLLTKYCPVFGFFDCCREPKSKDDILKYNRAYRFGNKTLDDAIKAGKGIDDEMIMKSAKEIAEKEHQF